MHRTRLAALKRNCRIHLRRTLDDLSSRARQRRYKSEVPFVDVPAELLAQWDSVGSLLREERDWFFEAFTAAELTAMRAFDEALDQHLRGRQRLADVPEVFDDARWQAIMRGARRLRSRLASDAG